MATTEIKNFDHPDEERPFAANGGVKVVKLGAGPVGKGVFEPGWRWSENVKPIAKTESCQTAHFGYVLSGRMRIAMDGGAESEIGPGDVVHIPPGHDAWVVGSEACVLVDWGQIQDYALAR